MTETTFPPLLLAGQAAASGVRVNAVAPGQVETSLVPIPRDAMLAMTDANHLIKRPIQPEEVRCSPLVADDHKSSPVAGDLMHTWLSRPGPINQSDVTCSPKPILEAHRYKAVGEQLSCHLSGQGATESSECRRQAVRYDLTYTTCEPWHSRGDGLQWRRPPVWRHLSGRMIYASMCNAFVVDRPCWEKLVERGAADFQQQTCRLIPKGVAGFCD